MLAQGVVTGEPTPPMPAPNGQRLSDRMAKDATRLRIGTYDSTPRPTCGFRTPQGKRKFALAPERDSAMTDASLGHVGTYVDPGAIRTRDLRFRKPLLYPAELRDRRAGPRGTAALEGGYIRG